MREFIEDWWKMIVTIAAIFIAVIILWETTAYRDIDKLVVDSPAFLEQRGFELVSYDGYEGNTVYGGITWYLVKDGNGYLYSLATSDWRGEIMLYNVKCLNAVTNE